MAKRITAPKRAAPPSASGPAGAQLEGKIGAFYLLSLLASGELRGLPGATAHTIRFQQAAHGRVLDDIIVDAVNADGTKAYLDIQGKRTLDFTASNSEFADVVKRLWATSQTPEFSTTRYEMAVAVERTSTRIERDCKEVLHWARQVESADEFAAHIALPGFSSGGKRDFVKAFQTHLAAAGAPGDDATLWRILRRFQILVFDFEGIASDYDNRARERARSVLTPEEAGRAAELWSVLCNEALTRDAAGGSLDRPALVRLLSEERNFRIGQRPDLRAVHARLAEASEDALKDIRDTVGGVRLPRLEHVEQAYQALEKQSFLQLVGASGVGKSAILKSLANRLMEEGVVIVLTPSRIVGGGWLRMRDVIGCQSSRNELFNELACGGGATLFIDNIDQIEDPAAWATLNDLLHGVQECPGWKVVVTVRSDSREWRASLPEAVRDIPDISHRVTELNDDEAAWLQKKNPALSALLSASHPARAIARNLFNLSRLVELGSQPGNATLTLVTEVDLAEAWWQLGGGRSQNRKWERLRLLRELGERSLREPGLAAFPADELDSPTIAELLHAETLREDRPGLTVAFWHDTLRDWTIGFLLSEKPELLGTLPKDRPMPAALDRGIEIAARLALRDESKSEAWLALLTAFEGEDRHGSWKRPVLLALPRSENAIELFGRVEPVVVANKGKYLQEIIRLLIAVETAALSQIADGLPVSVAKMAIPTSQAWHRVVSWIVTAIDHLPSATIPETAKLFHCWLVATRLLGKTPPINHFIIQKLHAWLVDIDEALKPAMASRIEDMKTFDLDFGNARDVRDEIRITFLSFCELEPDLAAQYLASVDPTRHDAVEIIRFPGLALKAAPAALVDLAIAAFIRKDEAEHHYSRRSYLGPFDITDHDFALVSPGQGPFFQLLENSTSEGLRLIRALVEHATDWNDHPLADGQGSLPAMTIPFPEGTRSFRGGFGIYQWARGGTGPLIVASALMALEAWAHRQVEGGRDVSAVLDEILGPAGSSAAFVCVAVDIALSHWQEAKHAAWPFLASPELLHFDHNRLAQDTSGLGRFPPVGQESEHWPVKFADLATRSSRRRGLLEMIGRLTVQGPVEIHAHVKQGLDRAAQRVASAIYPDDSDPISGLRAVFFRACRMTDAANFVAGTIRLPDGREVEGHQYHPSHEEDAHFANLHGESNARVADLSLRLKLQKALEEPATSTPEVVANGIAWAKLAGASDAPETDAPDDHDSEWQARAVVTAAALAARDYDGTDWLEVEDWCRPILDGAIAKEEDLAARLGRPANNNAAIATLGYVGLYRRNPEAATRGVLLAQATRSDQAILHAIASVVSVIERTDPRLPHSIARIILSSSIYARHTSGQPETKEKEEARLRRIAETIRSETRWLDGGEDEPHWPVLPSRNTRRRRGIRIPGPSLHDEPTPPPLPVPVDAVDEHSLAALAELLLTAAIDGVKEWQISLAVHLLAWTIEANNGPPGDDQDARDNRPYEWNGSYFWYLGGLCAAIPFDRARVLFLEPMARLHDEAFYDAVATFLRAFDRSMFAPNTLQPENPVGVRALFAERLQRGRMADRLSERVSFSAETHLADALRAMFFQQHNLVAPNRPHLPEQWNGLTGVMEVLSPMVVLAPKSGFLAVIFLNLIENNPSPPLLPYLVSAVSAWSKEYGVGANFWNEHGIGDRICSWIEQSLAAGMDMTVLATVRDELSKCLDVLVSSGIAAARALEVRISDDKVGS